jgi:hypothetical protein
MNCIVTNNITTTKAPNGLIYYVEPAYQYRVIISKGTTVRFFLRGKTVTALLTSNGNGTGYGILYTLECLKTGAPLESLFINPTTFAGLELEILTSVNRVDNF